MLVAIKNWYKGNRIFIAIGITLIITFLSLFRVSPVMPKLNLNHADKYQHAVAYFVVTLSWIWSFQTRNNNKSMQLWILLAVFLFGVLMEVLQEVMTNYRTADVFDVLANTSGIVLAYLFFKVTRMKRVNLFFK
jgi:VanZ family protein